MTVTPFFFVCPHFATIFANSRRFQPADVCLPGGFQEIGVKGKGGIGLTKLGRGILSPWPWLQVTLSLRRRVSGLSRERWDAWPPVTAQD